MCWLQALHAWLDNLPVGIVDGVVVPTRRLFKAAAVFVSMQNLDYVAVMVLRSTSRVG